MGRSNRKKPARLGAKLSAIRAALGLTQEQMIERLNCPDSPLYPASISQYEQSKREPPLLVLLAYARVAGVAMEMLVDDDLDLPNPLPAPSGYALVIRRVRIGNRQ